MSNFFIYQESTGEITVTSQVENNKQLLRYQQLLSQSALYVALPAWAGSVGGNCAPFRAEREKVSEDSEDRQKEAEMDTFPPPATVVSFFVSYA